jgi:23S rRNA (cytosine1962-C5)-methyltransferase
VADYELLDLGDGRQLARFGAYVVDRPYPAAVDPPRDRAAWRGADLRFERDRGTGGEGRWIGRDGVPASWPLRHDGLAFELRPTPSGQVGFFAEQIPVWRWLRQRAADSVLNLFAYAGGSTLASAAAGASVTHVDATRSAVAWARRNAELSGLGTAPIRWIVDDALAFTAREARRGRRYGGVVLDPPSYGHGPKGEHWMLGDHVPGLLDACLSAAAPDAFILLTAHAEGWLPSDAEAELDDAFVRAGRGEHAAGIEAEALELHAASGAVAPAGVMARWAAG